MGTNNNYTTPDINSLNNVRRLFFAFDQFQRDKPTKARFFDRFESQLNDRQLKVIRRMLEEGPNGFKGGMNARKYYAISKVSKATATRELQDLLQKDAFFSVRWRAKYAI